MFVMAAILAMGGGSVDQGDALELALSCQASQPELATLMMRITHERAGKIRLVQQYALPTGDLLRLDAPVHALGSMTREIYVQPGRIAMVVDDPLAAITQRLQLETSPFSPASKPAGEGRAIVAWQMSQKGPDGKSLMGCEYQDPAAANWLDQVEGGQ